MATATQGEWLNEAAVMLRGWCKSLEAGTPMSHFSFRQLVTLYYVTSYVYYIMDAEIMADWVYEELCKELLHRFEDEDEYIYHPLDPALLMAGSGYALEYPVAIQNLARAAVLGGV